MSDEDFIKMNKDFEIQETIVIKKFGEFIRSCKNEGVGKDVFIATLPNAAGFVIKEFLKDEGHQSSFSKFIAYSFSKSADEIRHLVETGDF